MVIIDFVTILKRLSFVHGLSRKDRHHYTICNPRFDFSIFFCGYCFTLFLIKVKLLIILPYTCTYYQSQHYPIQCINNICKLVADFNFQ